jgi:beta-aspartyl-peptidase (threonine type)
MKNLLMLFSFILLLTANISAQSKTDKTATDIRRVMDAQATAWNAGDIEGYMRGYWNSPQLVFVSGDNVTKGWQPTLERYKKNYDSRAKMGTLSFTDVEIEVLSKDAAKVLGSWALAREADNPKGKFTLIFRRFKDGWKIVHDHTS